MSAFLVLCRLTGDTARYLKKAPHFVITYRHVETSRALLCLSYNHLNALIFVMRQISLLYRLHPIQPTV